MPGEHGRAVRRSPTRRVAPRARFIDYNLWVTPYRADERYPAGEFPNQHAGEDGLPAWTAADRPLETTDVVLWYMFGAITSRGSRTGR